jgi:hypothetical protein
MRIPFLRRAAATVAAPAAALVLAIGGLAALTTPAHAADGPALRLNVASENVGLPIPTTPGDTQVSWGVTNDGPGTANDVKISLDLSEVIDWAIPEGTVPADHIYTWDRGDVTTAQGTGGLLALDAKPGTPLGTTGVVTLSGTSSNGTFAGDIKVRLTVGTTDLVVNKLSKRTGDKPGSTIDEPVTISNTGTLPANGVQLRLRTTVGLAYAERYSNCVYGTVSENNYNMTNQALCTFDTVIEPGKAYKLSEPVGLDVTKQALFELFGDQAFPVTDATTSKADGPTLSLVPAGTADTGGIPANHQTIDADNTADMVGVGDTADGNPGDVVKVTVALRNDGPGWVGINANDDQPALLVTIPTGTTAVEIPEHCSVWSEDAKSATGEQTPGKPKYVCQSSPSEYAVGEARKFTFGLKIKADTTDTTIGEVRATTAFDNELTFDDNKANDTAAITVTVSSSTGGNQPDTQAGTGSELAETGGSSATPWIAAGGALALVVGAVLFGSVRLRRRRA